MVSPAIRAAARARRQGRIDIRVRWFDQQVSRNINIGIASRIKIAAQLLRDQVVVNIGDPVRKYKGPRSGRIQVDPLSRSRPGEFPKADTTRLMKDIFWQMDGHLSAMVGTTLDYGLILETERSFLRRTLNEMYGVIRNILVHGRGGGQALTMPGQE